MKDDIIKKLSPYDVAMIGNLYPMTQTDMKYIMWDKGDIEIPASTHPTVIITIDEEFDDPFKMSLGKSMKAADRRKRTYHKQQQREKKYRDLGYPIERFSASERGKMREGVGMFPETQHQYSMYNRNSCKGGMRGSRKEFKPITTKQAISMMEHEHWLDEQEAIAEYEEAERLFALDFISDLMYEVKLTDIKLDEEEERLAMLLNWVEEAQKSINSKKEYKEHCLKKIEKIEEGLNK